MGVRSFLIAFKNAEEIKKFYQWKDKISQIIFDFCDMKEKKEGENVLNWTHSYRYDCLQTLVQFAVTYPFEHKSEYTGGDWDLDLIGFSYWKGQIWGLIHTYTPGEDVFFHLMHNVLPENFHTRTSYLPDEYEDNTADFSDKVKRC